MQELIHGSKHPGIIRRSRNNQSRVTESILNVLCKVRAAEVTYSDTMCTLGTKNLRQFLGRSQSTAMD